MIQVATRLTPAEAKMVRAAAGLQGESISEFMRPLVLDAATELLQQTAVAMVEAGPIKRVGRSGRVSAATG